MNGFTCEKRDGLRRIGTFTTRNGVLSTPFFMPDATRASVRGVSCSDLETVGVGAMVVNTYHLMLQPGAEFMKSAGGTHRFMRWDRPLLSDSGGYQVYSLIHRNPELGRITEEGAEFRSVLDGSKHLLTPEKAIAIQFDLGTDMMVCLDDPRPNDAPLGEMTASVERTIRWAMRCKVEYEKQIAQRGLTEETRPLLFGVVQGGVSVELRRRCATELSAIGFDGYGFGGRHVDATGEFLEDIVRETAAAIPEDAIRFALGIGTPEDIVRCHALGWDMFDCVIPTREGRHGRLFLWNKQSEITNSKLQIPNKLQFPISNDQNEQQSVILSESEGSWDSSAAPQNDREENFYATININNEQFTKDFASVDPGCDCELCVVYTKAYLRHLFRVGDPLAGRLATLHNLRFYMRLMKELRK
jgi:queuine tRNA-ribosyltransferase